LSSASYVLTSFFSVCARDDPRQGMAIDMARAR
jgi:hypothetical protein